jgi:hypothetical protein
LKRVPKQLSPFLDAVIMQKAQPSVLVPLSPLALAAEQKLNSRKKPSPPFIHACVREKLRQSILFVGERHSGSNEEAGQRPML